jgi:hypothetical protein
MASAGSVKFPVVGHLVSHLVTGAADSSYRPPERISAQQLSGLPLLRHIGELLDHNRQVVVHKGGRVEPGLVTLHPPLGKRGKNNARGTPEGPKTGSRQRTTARGSPVARSGPTSEAAPFVGDTAVTTSGIDSVLDAYPEFRVQHCVDGVVIVGTVQPIRGLTDTATIFVRIDEQLHTIAPSAWWECGVWIGPRHTNYGEASICAFEPSDASWHESHGLVELVDLYTVWVVRHLHLRLVGRWPGPQRLHTVRERLREHMPGELCGCGSLTPYELCHRARDMMVPAFDRASEFYRIFKRGERTPPKWASKIPA